MDRLPALGEEYREDASVAGRRLDLDETAVDVDDPLRDGEPQARPPLLGRVEGVEYLPHDLRRDPVAGVAPRGGPGRAGRDGPSRPPGWPGWRSAPGSRRPASAARRLPPRSDRSSTAS